MSHPERHAMGQRDGGAATDVESKTVTVRRRRHGTKTFLGRPVAGLSSGSSARPRAAVRSARSPPKELVTDRNSRTPGHRAVRHGLCPDGELDDADHANRGEFRHYR